MRHVIALIAVSSLLATGSACVGKKNSACTFAAYATSP